MGVTRTEHPIDPPLPAWVRWGNQWVPVELTAAITKNGCSFNRAKFLDGNQRELPNDSLRFDDPAAEVKTRRVEYYRLWPGTDGERGTWDTGFIDVPADTDEGELHEAVRQATADVEWSDGLVPVAVGFYAYSEPLDIVSNW